ncbi:hypothetical protein NA57DRAFT_40437, partial [Rhizodiscina lignyota]
RAKNGCIRFGTHTKDALFHSYINILLVCVPAGLAVGFAGLNAAVVFAINAVAIVPLAGLLAHATEAVASRLGDTWGALLNVSFGNAVELIIFIIALAKNEIRITQASILGSILANLLLILGMAFFLGGLRYQEQIYNSTVTQMSACLLSLSVMSLLLPTAFHASWADQGSANTATLQVSRGTSVILLVIYVLYLLFQLKSHAYLYESTPQHIIDEESHPGILHDVLNSSSSSSSSDTSSDTATDSSSGSHTTAKRIKRAFRHRKRRKSSASSKETPSLPSAISSPSAEPEQFHPAASHQFYPGTSRRPSILDPVADDGDADDETTAQTGGTTVRDFDKREDHDSPPVERKHKKKKHKKGSRSRKHRASSQAPYEVSEIAPAGASNASSSIHEQQQPKVEFADERNEEKVLEAQREKIQSRNPFNVRIKREALRPPMPKMLSQNVFMSTPASGSPIAPPKSTSSRSVPMGPRRVRSLPDRMNTSHALSAMPSRTLPPTALPPASVPIEPESDDEDEEVPHMSRTAAIVLLLISTALVALCAELMVDAIPEMTSNSSVSQTFIGLIILPIVGNAAEHVTAVTVAAKNKMDLAIGVAVGSSIQIALFVTPLVVLLGWIMGKDMTLYFNLFETVSLFVTAFVVNFLVLDGRSNYLEGALLMGAYVIIAVAAFFYPDGTDQSALGGNGTEGAKRMAMMMFRG